jgi:hypothetical protein
MGAYSHSIVPSDRNALNLQRKYFSYMQKNRLTDPSKTCALDFKREFSAIGGSLGFSTIGVYRSIFPAGRPTKRHRASQRPSRRVTRARHEQTRGQSIGAWPMTAICY